MSKLSIIYMSVAVLILTVAITRSVITSTDYPDTYTDNCPDPQYKLTFNYNGSRKEMYSLLWSTKFKHLSSDQKWSLKEIPHMKLKINHYSGYITFPEMDCNSDSLLSVIMPIFKEG